MSDRGSGNRREQYCPGAGKGDGRKQTEAFRMSSDSLHTCVDGAAHRMQDPPSG